MACCQRQVIDDRFDQDFVAKKLRQYRQSGLKKETRLLVEALKSEGVEGLTVLDVGGGLGTIPHELIRAGARQTLSVEASQAFIAAAQTEAARQQLADRMTFLPYAEPTSLHLHCTANFSAGAASVTNCPECPDRAAIARRPPGSAAGCRTRPATSPPHCRAS